jgi:hypothetical protein
MYFFGLGFLLGRMSNSKTEVFTKKLNDNEDYSCLWWREKANRQDLSKQKIACLLNCAYRNNLVHKEYTDEGLCIFVPNSEEAQEEILEKISKTT